MISVVCAIIVNKENRILITQRSEKMSLPLKWEFPGGKVEQNENYEQTAIREIKEELNIAIRIKQQLDSVVHHYPTFSITLIPFICDYLAGEVVLLEHAAYYWFKPENLLDLEWAAADIPVVHQYLKTL